MALRSFVSLCRKWPVRIASPLATNRCYSVGSAAVATTAGGGDNDAVAKVTLTDGGRKLNLQLEGMPEKRYHSVWLRHNCRCSQCFSQSAQFSSVHPNKLTNDLRISDTYMKDNTVIVTFNTGHTSEFDLDWLVEYNYSGGAAAEQLDSKIKQSRPLVAETLPISEYRDVMESKEGMYNWMKQLNHYGISLMRNVPTEHGTVQKVGEKVGYIQETIYGTLFDVIGKEDPVNLAYGFDELNFHMDLLYYESPPGLQILHCLRNDPSVTGGESIMLDAYPVVTEMRKNHPKQFETLTKVPVTFYRVHHSHLNPCDMKMARPHIVLDRYGEITAINWNPHAHFPMAIPENMVEDYYEAFTLLSRLFDESKWKITHRLEPGEAFTFNNRRILHARSAFVLNGGMRHLQGVYVKSDFIRSKFEVLSNMLGKNERTKNVMVENMQWW